MYVEFKFVYQVRLDWLPLPCIALVEHLPREQYVVGSNLT